MTTQSLTIRYPRKPVWRGFLRFVGRGLMSLLTRPVINGMENLPKQGPLILVGNHQAMLEAVMMVLYSPWLVELLAAGEIPLDPRYAPLVNSYGYIPIQRGKMDREALQTALSVLNQGGVVGMFPEGGIWETKVKRGRTGVAWLSNQANAPVVPIGFGGIEGAFSSVVKLKRPRLVMNVGQMIPPIQPTGDESSRKAFLEEGTQRIMRAIEDLIPDEDKRRWNRIRDERFELQLTVNAAGGSPVVLPDELAFKQPDMLAKFLHRPLLLDVFARNLKLPVQALQRLDVEHDPKKLADSADAALGYMEMNPHFLSYRFGYQEGAAMQEGIRQLRDIARWAEQHGYTLTVTPIRRYRRRGSDEEIVEHKPGSIPSL